MKKTKWIAAALLAAALAFVACKNIEEGGEIQQPPAPEQGSGGNGDANQGGEQPPVGNGGSENLGGEEGNEGGNQGGEGGGENPGGEEGEGTPQPENPTTKAASDLLKEILTETEYNRISGELSSKGITLTAQTIKAIGDNFSVLVKDAENGSAQDTTKKEVNSYKEAFVAQDKNLINVTKTGNGYSLNSYNTNVVFSGEFNLDEISLPDNNGKGTFANGAILRGKNINLDKLNTIRGVSLPELHFDNVIYDSPEISVSESYVLYNLYRDYSKDLSKLDIKGNMQGIIVNGAKDKNDNFINGYTLFKDDDTAKPSTDTSVTSFTIDALIKMYEQLGIQKFVNMIISGTPTEATEVNWNLTNMIFEGDMSKIQNTGIQTLEGIVYFKDKVYNNVDINKLNPGQSVIGLLKLDKLDNVSYDTLRIAINTHCGVLDVRGVDKNIIESYNNGILFNEEYPHAIYFSDDFSELKDAQEKINELCNKFSNTQKRRFINAYLGDDRVHGQSYDETLVPTYSIIGAKNPRKLKEFEYFGNYRRFEKSAKNTYTNDEFKSLSDFDQDKLDRDADKGLNQIALTNKRHFCIKAKDLV